MKYHGFASYDQVVRQPNLQELFEDWIIYQKQKVNPNGLATYYYGVKGFFDANDWHGWKDGKYDNRYRGTSRRRGFSRRRYGKNPTKKIGVGISVILAL